ncbi:MAG TPA: hypothetical protein VFV38_18855 [Ktedonobacteraceae bacterium]|nr:hypothetical protein [Ktedonobacteraceae bacterium]
MKWCAIGWFGQAAREGSPTDRIDETPHFLGKRWSHRVKPPSDDFTDKEAVGAILRIARGNIRLIERLMLQVAHVLLANQIQIVTKEVVETPRQNFIIGPD